MNNDRAGMKDDGPSRSERQEAQYERPYHHLITNSGKGIPYFSMLRVLRRLINPKTGESILDAGCGDGRLIRELGGSGAVLYGADTSIAALRFSLGFNPRALHSVQDIGALAFPDGFFSKISLIETLEHIHPEYVNAVLSELKRVLAPGGRLFVTVPSTLLPLQKKHYRHYSPGELGSLMKEYFTVELLAGHDRKSVLFELLTTFGDNSLWQLRAGFNRTTRWFYKTFLEDSRPDKARRLIAVCVKK